MARRSPASSPAPQPTAAQTVAAPRRRRSAAAPVAEASTVTVPAIERAVPDQPPSAPSKELHVFPNPAPERDYVIQFQIPEFTCHCPLTGQPDFAHFTIDMICDALCIELKSLKMYMWSFRHEGAFHEKVTNDILSKIVETTQPRFARITAKWYVRGGIYTNVVAEHRQPGWTPQVPVQLPQHGSERGLLG